MLQKYKINNLKIYSKFLTKNKLNKLIFLNLLKINKFIIINLNLNLNVLNSKLIKGLKLNIPASGISKFIPFSSISEYKKLVLNFKTINNLKINDKIYYFSKIENLIKKKDLINLLNLKLSKFLTFFSKMYLKFIFIIFKWLQQTN